MSGNITKLDYESIIKEEYEIQLYGFSLKEFTKENFLFIEDNISKSVGDLIDSFNHLLKNVSPELDEKVKSIKKSTISDVKQSCQQNIVALNKVIENSLKIPSNVLLFADSLHNTRSTQADIDTLSEECQRLEQLLLQNAFFIHALYAEIESFQQINEVFESDSFITSKAEENLNNNFDADLLLYTAKKMHALQEI